MDISHARWLGLVLLAVLFLATALYGWRLSPAGSINRRFASQTLVLTWWVTGVAGAHSGHAIDIWGRWAFTAACLMPATFFRFALVFPTPHHIPPTFVRRLIYGLGGLLGLVAALTPWIAHDYRVDANGILTRTAGPLMAFFVGYYVLAAAVVFVIYARKWRSARGVPRVQLRLYCVGFLVFCLGGIATNMASPVIVGDSRYGALGPCFVMAFLAFLAHGIMRHRLMNTRLVIHNWLTVSIASIASVAPLLIIASHLEVGSRQHRDFRLLGLVVAAGLLAPPLWIATRRIVYRYVHRDYTRFQTLISDASGRLSQVLSSAETAAVVSDTIMGALNPQGIAVYLGGGTPGGCFTRIHYVGDGESFAAPLAFPGELTAAFAVSSLIASPDYIPLESQCCEARSPIALDHSWAGVFPFMSEKKLLGVMVVGPKRSHAPYYHEDVRLLQVLTSQATVAFKNSVLYERVLFANRYIENIVATVQSGILVVDGKENVRLLNHAATNLLGLATQEVPTSLPLQTLPEAIVTVLNETLATDAPSRTVEVRITRNSIEACLMCCATPLKGMDGGVAGVVASLSDLSTLKQLEIERARAERLNYFENLAAALAHEIANPIVPIKIMTQLLSTRSGESAFIADFVRTVGREVSRIETLVQRLNSLSSPASRRITHVDLRAVVSQVFDLVEAMFEEKQVRLHVRLEPHRLMVLGEENELQELFLNLVTNALEATPSGGSVEVQGTIDSDEIVVSVRDTGPGVPSQLASQIFEPFVSSKNRGSGLGLAICHGIVKRHQGEIQALNADIGAVFTVRLPTSAKDLPPGSPDLRQIQGSRPNKPA